MSMERTIAQNARIRPDPTQTRYFRLLSLSNAPINITTDNVKATDKTIARTGEL